ncbi:MAG TPA: biotin--[acetyl-CoA-carboxylase] ligase [Actinomycetota bacterium]|nr:biotin--[acetyl-CoA-carboxylase] ligase [Actinomycetota bacterium]
MLTRDDLLAALAAIRESAPVRADEVTGSTNATAGQLADDGAPEWTLVSAGHQTDGRGRLGRAWVDEPDRSLILSIVLRPAIAPGRAGILSLAAGAAMAEAIREVAGLDATCKWPNDILVGRAKVGGVLLESSVEGERFRWVVVGVGVNLVPPDGVENAGGVGDVGTRALAIAFLRRLHALYEGEEREFALRVRSSWLTASSTIGRLVEATTSSGATVVGRAVGIDDFGALQLSTDDGERRVTFGEVVHLGDAGA